MRFKKIDWHWLTTLVLLATAALGTIIDATQWQAIHATKCSCKCRCHEVRPKPEVGDAKLLTDEAAKKIQDELRRRREVGDAP